METSTALRMKALENTDMRRLCKKTEYPEPQRPKQTNVRLFCWLLQDSHCVYLENNNDIIFVFTLEI